MGESTTQQERSWRTIISQVSSSELGLVHSRRQQGRDGSKGVGSPLFLDQTRSDEIPPKSPKNYSPSPLSLGLHPLLQETLNWCRNWRIPTREVCGMKMTWWQKQTELFLFAIWKYWLSWDRGIFYTQNEKYQVYFVGNRDRNRGDKFVSTTTTK